MPETKTAAGTKPKTRKPRRTKRKIVDDHVRSYFKAAASRDPEAMAKHWANDGVELIPGSPPLRGPDAIKAYFRELFAALPDAEFAVQRIVADETGAAVEWRLSGTFTGAPYQGIEATGRRVELRGCDVLEVKASKLTSNMVYFDATEFARQVGMLPPADSGAERAMKGAFNTVTKLRRAVNERKRGSAA
jgi:steroid delta-isomerase-like uncharacterized protein